MHKPSNTVSRLTVVLAVSGLSTAVHAQNSENPYFEEFPTVLSASRLPLPLNEAPGAVTVLDGNFIRATGYRDLARIFRLVPGMQVGQERANHQWVTYHGMGNTYPSEMQVLIDGRSVYSPSAFGGVDWAALPLTVDEIERIEVMRGTNSVTFGANAFLGVINIITRRSDDRGPSNATARVGSDGIADLSASVGATTGAASWSAHASTSHDDGYPELHDQRHITVASGRADWRLSGIDELMVRLAGSQSITGLGYADSLFGNNAERDAHGQTGIFHVKWTRTLSPDEDFYLSYYRNHESIVDEWLADGGPGTYVPLNRNRDSTRDNLEFQHHFSPTGSTQVVWGGDWRRDWLESSFLYATRESVTTDLYRLFGNVEWQFAPDWRANLGAAFEKYSDEPSHLAPRAFVNWQATPSSTWRAGYGRAWQQRPTFEKYGEIYAYDKNSGTLLAHPYVPNPDLVQARVDSYEVGYLGRFKTWDSTLDVRVFQENITDYVVRVGVNDPAPLLAPYLGSSMYVNREQAYVLQGIEYQFKFHPWDKAEILFNHTMINSNSGDSALDRRVAPYNASLTWVQRYGSAWRSQLTVLHMGPLAGGDGFVPLAEYTANSYTSLDARVSYTTRVGGHPLELALNAINIGAPHQEIADRSQQAARAASGDVTPANRVASMVWLSATLDF